MSNNGSDPRFAFDMLRDDQRGLVAKILLTATSILAVVLVHSVAIGGTVTLIGSARLFVLYVALATVLWVPVHVWRRLRK